MSGGLDLNAPLISTRRLSKNGARKDSSTHFPDGKTIHTLQSNHNRVASPNKAGMVPFNQVHSPGNPKTQNGSAHALRLPPGRMTSVAENGGSHTAPLVQAPVVDSWVQQSISDGGSNCPDIPRQLVSTVKMSRLISIDSRGEEGDNNSEAAEAFLSEAFLGRVSVCSGAEEQEQVVSHTDPHARDFIMRRFLPAAQAMASEASDTYNRRHSLDSQSSYGRTSTGSSILRPTRFATVIGEVSKADEEAAGDLSPMASGSPSRMNTHAHLSRTSFHTALSSSKSHSPKFSSWRKTDEEHSVRSEEFWSDEEAYERCEHRLHHNGVPGYVYPNMEGQSLRSTLQEDAIHMAGIIKGSESDGYPMQVMENLKSSQLLPRVKSHGFLGMPKCAINKESSRIEGEGEQLDRLGNRHGNMLSESNYADSCGRHVSFSEEVGAAVAHGQFSEKYRRQDEMIKVETVEDYHLALHTPSAPTETQITASGQRKWAEKGSAKSLMPPPLPKSPSESWLWNSVPAIRSGQTKVISHRSLPAGEQANTWEAKALRTIENSPSRVGSLGV